MKGIKFKLATCLVTLILTSFAQADIWKDLSLELNTPLSKAQLKHPALKYSPKYKNWSCISNVKWNRLKVEHITVTTDNQKQITAVTIFILASVADYYYLWKIFVKQYGEPQLNTVGRSIWLLSGKGATIAISKKYVFVYQHKR